ncbi:MAG: protein-methionine-sulfoxide reductase catalytic subunit MsrP [Anaerolineae bacterium]|jgi:sulfoxide reductase catalytic subunit YedY
MVKIHPSEITPEHVYVNRRQFLIGAGAVIASWALGGCACPQEPEQQPPSGTAVPVESPQASADAGDLEDELNTFEEITTFNNFYEFSLSKTAVAGLAEDFKTSPWRVEVGGLVSNPNTFGLEDILKFEQEERIYRMRCVEAWSMVIPWNGFPLRKLLEEVEPTSDAKYVRFETLYDPEQMPGQNSSVLDWPYVEGLRLDEAMHDLTLLATGLYGKDLLPQNGAPVRLVVPWKYGFKSIKSIVGIKLVAEQPVTTWAAASPTEYGFYANVNPDVSHPRWSQASERRIGESGRRETLLFNGYGEEVAALYEGMDLEKKF